MNPWLSPTPWFVLYIVAVVIVYDLAALYLLGQPQTITGVLWTMQDRWPVVSWVLTVILATIWAHLVARWF